MPRKPTNQVEGAAVLAFLADWRQLQHGDITAGGSLIVRYEPTRFMGAGEAAREIVGYARFLPGGEVRRATLRGRARARRPATAVTAAPIATEITVPPETRQVELWFEGSGASGETVWDSRFGENYRFDVVGPRPRPADSLHVRRSAVVDAASIAVAEPARLAPGLQVAANVVHAVDPTSVWVDVYYFDGAATLIHGDTLPLRPAGPGEGASDRFVLDGTLQHVPAESARIVQYRLYCELDGHVVTDGELHQAELSR